MPFYTAYKSLSHYPDFLYWNLRGRPERPPHLVKQRTLLDYAQRYNLKTLIETGTYYGEMVAALKNDFERIDSIEYDPDLARRAAHAFASLKNIRIIQGASEEVIPELLKSLTQPALFWLDAGYYTWDGLPRDTQRLPTELAAILGHSIRNHVVLIDDASSLHFEGAENVPELLLHLAARFPGRAIDVKYDIVRITPRPANNVS